MRKKIKHTDEIECAACKSTHELGSYLNYLLCPKCLEAKQKQITAHLKANFGTSLKKEKIAHA